jgi:hypothetical protein
LDVALEFSGMRKSVKAMGIGGDRLYVNYPNYGIYVQF